MWEQPLDEFRRASVPFSKTSSGLSSCSAQSAISSPDLDGLTEELRRHRLQHVENEILAGLLELGVKTKEDFGLLDEGDLVRMNLSVVDMRKLKHILSSKKGLVSIAPPPDRASSTFQSLTVQGLEELVGSLARLAYFESLRLPPHLIGSRHLRDYLLQGGAHPAELFPHCFSTLPPEAAVSYEWTLSFEDMLSFLHDEPLRRSAAKWNAVVPAGSPRVWIDVLFVDQRWPNIHEALRSAQNIYAQAPLHLLLLTPTCFSRAWCLFELATRRQAGGGKGTVAVVSGRPDLQRELVSNGFFFDGMQATEPDDLRMIREVVWAGFGSAAAFDRDLGVFFLAAGGCWAAATAPLSLEDYPGSSQAGNNWC